MTEENKQEINEDLMEAENSTTTQDGVADEIQDETIIAEEISETTSESDEDVADASDDGDLPPIKATETVEFKDLNNKYLRLHAEFDNYRRRTARENLELVERANAKVLTELCEVIENFDRALETEAGSEAHEDFVKGVSLIAEQFGGILKNHGLEVINPEGLAFDPNQHEAMMQQPSEDIAADHVLQVFQKGYKVKEKVIRHAKVIVSAGA